MKDSREAYTLVLFVLMLIPVVVEPINKIWHTGSYQAFPGRYGYILVLLGPVSYTHLDVYKRQALTCPCTLEK